MISDILDHRERQDDFLLISFNINGLAIQTLRRVVEHAPSHAQGAGSSGQHINKHKSIRLRNKKETR